MSLKMEAVRFGPVRIMSSAKSLVVMPSGRFVMVSVLLINVILNSMLIFFFLPVMSCERSVYYGGRNSKIYLLPSTFYPDIPRSYFEHT